MGIAAVPLIDSGASGVVFDYSRRRCIRRAPLPPFCGTAHSKRVTNGNFGSVADKGVMGRQYRLKTGKTRNRLRSAETKGLADESCLQGLPSGLRTRKRFRKNRTLTGRRNQNAALYEKNYTMRVKRERCVNKKA